ncbi:hypothetical protein [Spiroplasma cantharicola]|uniref:PTS EIIB type-1 domain-containing protein n=1 Tax=Spiroplasma cantharicola TaxID=362837 RepID=A0A0M4KE11_9MOLU|nr:hypothetical protein [Spiroplasma cantharicola]ALD66132.1 hypothetical protein SCANT_v1c02220 [Spiroplasma cantharicola]
MNNILYIVIAILFVICFISLFLYFSTVSMLKKRKEKFGINSIEKGATIYEKILDEIGTIENIDGIKEQKIMVLSKELVNLNNLKKLKIKAEFEEKQLTLTSKEFSIKLFLKKLSNELKNKIN